MRDEMAIIGTFIIAAVVIAYCAYWEFTETNKCNAKGGMLIEGQCIKVEVIK